MPSASVAEIVANQVIRRRPCRTRARARARRLRSPGISAISRTTSATTAAIAAGTIVMLTGPSPGSTPIRSRIPKTITAST